MHFSLVGLLRQQQRLLHNNYSCLEPSSGSRGPPVIVRQYKKGASTSLLLRGSFWFQVFSSDVEDYNLRSFCLASRSIQVRKELKKESVLTKTCSNCTVEILCCTSLNSAMLCLITTRQVNDPHCPRTSNLKKLEVSTSGCLDEKQ